MQKTITLVFSSVHNVTADVIWASIKTFANLNRELSPVISMYCPRDYDEIPFEKCPLNKFMFTSTVRLLRVLPIERYRVRLISVRPGEGFLEKSESLFTSAWEHKRAIEDFSDQHKIEDRLTITVRCFMLVPFVYILTSLVFWNRHRNLLRLFENVEPR